MHRKCPNCGLHNTRRSAVRAYELTPRHIFLSPYRCRDCRHRFWVISRNVWYLTGIVGAALVAGAVAWNMRTLLEGPSAEQENVSVPSGDFAATRARAEKNDPEAEYELSSMYAHGYGAGRSDVEAQRWLERAAEHGNVMAQYDLGLALRDGRGAVQDYDRAVKWIRRAADNGHGPAQYALGVMYRSGTGVPADNVKAYTWLNLAAARGVADAAILRDQVLSRLTPAEVIEAQSEARRLSDALPNAPTPAR
jgi:uncharacterized protein